MAATGDKAEGRGHGRQIVPATYPEAAFLFQRQASPCGELMQPSHARAGVAGKAQQFGGEEREWDFLRWAG
jgi:hypothetical protein